MRVVLGIIVFNGIEFGKFYLYLRQKNNINFYL
jgi:hypothetical protein